MVIGMHQRWLPIILLATFVVSSCDNDETARPIDPPAPTTDEQIIADCYVVRDALEAYAAANGGVYPAQVSAILPFLPGGSNLTNRYTGLATVPVFYDPQWPGEIGVLPFFSESWRDPPAGYRVTGRGRDGVLITLDNVSMVSPLLVAQYDSVLANSETIVAAVEEFYRQAGHFPADVGADPLPSGDVLSDLLPGGELLATPFLGGLRASPVDGDPTGVPGIVGYTAQDRNADGVYDGYLIESIGADWISKIAVRRRESPEDEVVRSAALLLRSAAEAFASQNGGEYPRDIDIDQTPSGDTLRDLVYNRLNPYTGAPAYRNGLATSRGEVGYVGLEYNGIVVGYVINALGLFNAELERFEVLTN